jgi:hypothetical protein
MTKTLRLLLALAVAAALSLAACGGDDDDSGSASGSGSGSASGSVDEEEESEGDDDDELSVGDLDGDCLEAFSAFSDVASSAGMLGGEEADIEQSLDQFEAFAEAAPEEISDDMEVLAEAYRSFVDAMIDTGYDPDSGEVPDEGTMEALTEAMEPLSSDEVTEASNNVSAYFEEACGTGG